MSDSLNSSDNDTFIVDQYLPFEIFKNIYFFFNKYKFLLQKISAIISHGFDDNDKYDIFS